MQMRILGDRLLVKLAPRVEDRQTAAGIILEPAMTPAVCYGKVVQVGPQVRDIAEGAVVTFGPSVGEPLDGYFPTPHILIRERDVDTTVDVGRKAQTA